MATYVRRPRNSPEHDPTSAEIVTEPDGSERLIPFEDDDQRGKFTNLAMRPVEGKNLLDAWTAMQLGMVSLLSRQVCTRIGLDVYIRSGEVQSSRFELQRILFDWPTASDELDPMPSVALVQRGPVSYGTQGLAGGQIMEETLNAYGDGTVLVRTGVATATMDAVAWSAHKEERRGIAKMFEDLLLAEPREEMAARRVVVRDYFDRVLRVRMDSATRDDGPDSAQRNQWVYAAAVSCEIDVVRLVHAPPLLQSVGFQVSTDLEE